MVTPRSAWTVSPPILYSRLTSIVRTVCSESVVRGLIGVSRTLRSAMRDRAVVQLVPRPTRIASIGCIRAACHAG